MSLIVLLDAGPLGLVTNSRGGSDAEQYIEWMMSLRADKILLMIRMRLSM